MRGRYVIIPAIVQNCSKKSVKKKNRKQRNKDFAILIGRALRRAGQVARKTARAHGTPIYVWRDGKVVADKP